MVGLQEEWDDQAKGDAMEEDEEDGPSTAIMLAEDKKYYPSAEEVYGAETETLVMEEDAQPLEVRTRVGHPADCWVHPVHPEQYTGHRIRDTSAQGTRVRSGGERRLSETAETATVLAGLRSGCEPGREAVLAARAGAHRAEAEKTDGAEAAA